MEKHVMAKFMLGEFSDDVAMQEGVAPPYTSRHPLPTVKWRDIYDKRGPKDEDINREDLDGHE